MPSAPNQSDPSSQTDVVTEQSVLEFDGVSKSFRAGSQTTYALSEVSFHIKPGKVTGLIGPDGAGKTTLMRLATGILRPDTGRITALGLDTTSEALTLQTSLGYMPQRFGLYEDLTVQENLDLYADLQGLSRAERPERFEQLMVMTGMARFTNRLAKRLSGGMKQKLGLACTLLRTPRLLLLDEPTVGVDPVSRRELWSIVYRLVEEASTTVLLSTAYLDEAERCHDLLLMHQGELIAQGPPKTFRERMKGRAFTATARGRKNRELQSRLAGALGVVDAVIQGPRVRLVMESGRQPLPEILLPGGKDVVIEPVSPRFEDAFIDMLQARREEGLAPGAIEVPSLDMRRDNRIDGPMIGVRDVKRRFGSFYAVKGVSFEVERGEVFGLLGANGAGKSTTFRMLCGLLPASAGHLSVAGVDVRKTAAAARARIGYMSQKFSLYGNLNVRQNLRFFSSAYGLRGRRRESQIGWALEQFELEAWKNAKSEDLSLGYKQRLAMACALMHQPDVLFLDEPTSGVDPLARREFWHRINALAAEKVTVLVTTHFMEEAEYCDRMAIMADGEILKLGTPQEIRDEARSDEHPSPTMEDAFIALIQSRPTGGREA